MVAITATLIARGAIAQAKPIQDADWGPWEPTTEPGIQARAVCSYDEPGRGKAGRVSHWDYQLKNTQSIGVDIQWSIEEFQQAIHRNDYGATMARHLDATETTPVLSTVLLGTCISVTDLNIRVYTALTPQTPPTPPPSSLPPTPPASTSNVSAAVAGLSEPAESACSKTDWRCSEKECDGGKAKSCYALGVIYQNGDDGLKQDLTKAISLFHNACDGGNSDGCTSLGDLYATGDGVAQDMAIARRYFQQSCNLGDRVSCILAGAPGAEGSAR
jgi:hypothetical protein